MILMNQIKVIDAAAGTKLAKDCATAGGTPSGSFITIFLEIKKCTICTVTIDNIIAENRPAAPKLSTFSLYVESS